jgi:hypothetical protein
MSTFVGHTREFDGPLLCDQPAEEQADVAFSLVSVESSSMTDAIVITDCSAIDLPSVQAIRQCYFLQMACVD